MKIKKLIYQTLGPYMNSDVNFVKNILQKFIIDDRISSDHLNYDYPFNVRLASKMLIRYEAVEFSQNKMSSLIFLISMLKWWLCFQKIEPIIKSVRRLSSKCSYRALNCFSLSKRICQAFPEKKLKKLRQVYRSNI